MSAFRVDVRKRVKAALQRPKVRTEVRPYGLHTISTRVMQRTAPPRARGDRVLSSQKALLATKRRRGADFFAGGRSSGAGGLRRSLPSAGICQRPRAARIKCRKTHHRSQLTGDPQKPHL